MRYVVCRSGVSMHLLKKYAVWFIYFFAFFEGFLGKIKFSEVVFFKTHCVRRGLFFCPTTTNEGDELHIRCRCYTKKRSSQARFAASTYMQRTSVIAYWWPLQKVASAGIRNSSKKGVSKQKTKKEKSKNAKSHNTDAIFQYIFLNQTYFSGSTYFWYRAIPSSRSSQPRFATTRCFCWRTLNRYRLQVDARGD